MRLKRFDTAKSPRRRAAWLWALLIACACAPLVVDANANAAESKEKYVSAMVYAKWSETPLLLEASEFVHKNNPNGFWQFVNDITESKKFDSLESRNNETYFNDLLERAAKYVTPMQFDLLRLALSIRTYSPAIEMSRKLAKEANPDCFTFVEVHDQITCDVDQIEALIKSADRAKTPFVYQFDKHFNFKTVEPVKITVILYAQLGTAEFLKFHEKILSLARTETGQANKYAIDYVLRHNYKPVNSDELKNVVLSGYGVELDIKSTEYKAKDDTKVNADGGAESGRSEDSKVHEDGEESTQGFLFGKLKDQHPQLSEQLDEYKKYLVESTLELAPLKVWQMQDLSVQAAQRILESDSSDALNVLEDLAQNFPVRARALSKIKVKADLKKTFKSQRSVLESKMSLEAGAGAIYLNGLELNLDTTDIFSLSSLLTKESKLLEGLSQSGLDVNQVKDLIYLDTSSKNTDYGVDIRDTSIQWLNDLEKDSKYSYWSKSVQDILRPTYPGMMRSIAKNFYNLLLIVDPAREEAKHLIKTVESFFVNEVPIRLGVAFVTNNNPQADGLTDASVALYRAFTFVRMKTNSVAKALSFVTDVYAKLGSGKDGKEITSELVIKEFKRRYPKEEKNVEDIFGSDSDYDEGRMLTMDYFNKIGMNSVPQVIINGFPLGAGEIEPDVFEESVITKIMQLTSDLQMSVYRGQLSDSHNLVDWLMSKDVIMPRLNSRILAVDREYVQLNELDPLSRDFLLSELGYVYFGGKSSGKAQQLNSLTLWVVCDPDTEKGRQLIHSALNYQESSKVGTRLAFLFKRSDQDTDGDQIKRAIVHALAKLDFKGARAFIKTLVKEKSFNEIKRNKKPVSKLDFKEPPADEQLDAALEQLDLETVLNKHNDFLVKYTPFKNAGSMGLVANGRLLGPFESHESFIDSDFLLLESFMLKTGLKQIDELFGKWDLERLSESSKSKYSIDDMILVTNALLGKYSSTDKRTKLPTFSSGVVNIKQKRANAPYFEIVVVVDPLTRQAQKMSTILKVLTKTTNINLLIYFNCKEKHSAPPLKSFYRYVLEPENRFKNGQLARPFAYFHGMPQSSVLTMNIHPPESWMVEAVNSPYDLDNIILSEIDSQGAYGEFELEHLVIEGHAYDVLSGQSPRGLQFNLGTKSSPFMYDTIVMANLGYFQLKASPGSWVLQLREGRSKDIYEIVSHENTDSESKRSAIIHIVIDSFEPKVIRVKVSKKADKVNENLLDEKDSGDAGEGGIWNSINKMVGGGGGDEASGSGGEAAGGKENVLNIFSVASGHLYERLMRIMMLTVLRNTQAKVKFWFLKNYLSPQHTKFLEYYSKKYGFEYELVQYKWPRWLHQQSEKQRIIWGYKILFLDVLFPLSVEKIIYVDADQIVRADLTELRDLNLKGAPYGYVPFCDSRKEMDGYRFWKSGYWQMHLGNRKYHISALYVVDLKKFRKIAAGDRLRGQYQGLSQDPNSLSNLDQDLPNNMIHQVNIFSLPQEWLYCDTWCSSDTLAKAKTIDLCNNPQTKEPKLEAAMRIVPEWKDYDNEIKAVMREWQQETKRTPVIPDVATAPTTLETETSTKATTAGKDADATHDHSDL